MTLMFLVDAGVGRKVEQWLAASGHNVKAVRTIDPRMTDNAILQMAVDESRIVITMDKDFGEMVYRVGQAHAGVLLLRLDEANSEEKVHVVVQIIQSHGEKLEGRFSVYQSGRLRIR